MRDACASPAFSFGIMPSRGLKRKASGAYQRGNAPARTSATTMRSNSRPQRRVDAQNANAGVVGRIFARFEFAIGAALRRTPRRRRRSLRRVRDENAAKRVSSRCSTSCCARSRAEPGVAFASETVAPNEARERFERPLVHARQPTLRAARGNARRALAPAARARHPVRRAPRSSPAADRAWDPSGCVRTVGAGSSSRTNSGVCGFGRLARTA